MTMSYTRRYRRALATNPACPAEVRLGIAACQFHLGEMGASAQAFERVLALDPHNANALMGLAVIKFRSSNVQQVRVCSTCATPSGHTTSNRSH